MDSISLLGKKIGMTQIFNNDGCAIAVTILQLGPCIITQIKNHDNDGYQAIQLGYNKCNQNKLTKAELGHLYKSSLPPLKYLKEYRVTSVKNFYIGKIITVDQLKIGSLITVCGLSIGKGFTGCQKRHNFRRGPMTHGSKNHRQPGSIGAGTTPGRVYPGKKMAGRIGNKKITIQNLQIIDINPENHIIIIKGSVPGKTGSIISIRQQ